MNPTCYLHQLLILASSSQLRRGLPLWLARLHRDTPVGASVELSIAGWLDAGTPERLVDPESTITIADLLTGAGFTTGSGTVTRAHSLPDWVGPGMKVLVIGLNPSPASADRGVNFARGGNRFWPAALASGLVSVDRDPEHALLRHGVGFTDLAKRTTRTAAELDPSELRAGADRLSRLVEWLRPQVCVMVGLSGWRLAVDPKATAGWQPEQLGPCPTYLMPNTSGLNAHSRPEDFVHHLTTVANALGDRPGP